MKTLKVVLASVALVGMSFSAMATETVKPLSADSVKHSCYLPEQKKTEYCQKIMFPPMPFR